MGRDQMITIATLRAAGLTEAQVLRVIEIEQTERIEQKREAAKIRSRNYRARHASERDAVTQITRDARDARDATYIDPSLLPSSEKKRKKGRKIDMPIDWKPAVSAEDEGELERFKRYCKANGKTYVDWDAAWGNWRTSPYRGGQNGAGRQKGDRRHSISAAFDDIFAKLEGSDGASVVPFQANPRLLPNRRRE
jgi:hypothetical protein